MSGPKVSALHNPSGKQFTSMLLHINKLAARQQADKRDKEKINCLKWHKNGPMKFHGVLAPIWGAFTPNSRKILGYKFPKHQVVCFSHRGSVATHMAMLLVPQDFVKGI